MPPSLQALPDELLLQVASHLQDDEGSLQQNYYSLALCCRQFWSVFGYDLVKHFPQEALLWGAATGQLRVIETAIRAGADISQPAPHVFPYIHHSHHQCAIHRFTKLRPSTISHIFGHQSSTDELLDPRHSFKLERSRAIDRTLAFLSQEYPALPQCICHARYGLFRRDASSRQVFLMLCRAAVEGDSRTFKAVCRSPSFYFSPRGVPSTELTVPTEMSGTHLLELAHIAACGEHLSILKFLIQTYQVDINGTTRRFNETMLTHTCWSLDSRRTIEMLLLLGARPLGSSTRNESLQKDPLARAISWGHLPTAIAYIELGAYPELDANRADELFRLLCNPWIPQSKLPCCEGHRLTYTEHVVIDSPWSTTSGSLRGSQEDTHFCSRGDSKRACLGSQDWKRNMCRLMDLLLAKGARLNSRVADRSISRETPLMLAFIRRNSEHIWSDVDLRAAKKQSHSIVRFLIDRGAKVNSGCGPGNMPLEMKLMKKLFDLKKSRVKRGRRTGKKVVRRP
ncbi:hypothetical protein QBC35DRAFT_499813 [Podospora australis]|uniref:Uncharacterized protein n=1 Tax=Podospora australis TaxID=1536484 RepID=A0AAN6WRU9_9PEZI|nr:hypothetical protein QBC35DRAFT_499813 [Podospora australis]